MPEKRHAAAALHGATTKNFSSSLYYYSFQERQPFQCYCPRREYSDFATHNTRIWWWARTSLSTPFVSLSSAFEGKGSTRHCSQRPRYSSSRSWWRRSLLILIFLRLTHPSEIQSRLQAQTNSICRSHSTSRTKEDGERQKKSDGMKSVFRTVSLMRPCLWSRCMDTKWR